MPENLFALQGKLEKIGNSAKIDDYYATNVNINIGRASMPVTILALISEKHLGKEALLLESYEHNKKTNERIFHQWVYFCGLDSIERKVIF